MEEHNCNGRVSKHFFPSPKEQRKKKTNKEKDICIALTLQGSTGSTPQKNNSALPDRREQPNRPKQKTKTGGMAFCHKCGAKLDEESVFCGSCGEAQMEGEVEVIEEIVEVEDLEKKAEEEREQRRRERQERREREKVREEAEEKEHAPATPQSTSSTASVPQVSVVSSSSPPAAVSSLASPPATGLARSSGRRLSQRGPVAEWEDGGVQVVKAMAEVFAVDAKSKNGYVVCGYREDGATLFLQGYGYGGPAACLPLLQDDQQQYVMVRIPDGQKDVPSTRDVLITWQGRSVPIIRKGRYGEHRNTVLLMFEHSHAHLTCLGDRKNFTEELIRQRSAPLSGSHEL